MVDVEISDYDVVVVGAGFAGSVFAERAASIGKKVLIIDKRNHIGGNSYDELDDSGILVHKYGPHLFHTNSSQVFNYLSKFTRWDLYFHKVLSYVDSNLVPFPFNLNSLYVVFPPEFAKKLESKLLNLFSFGDKISILDLKNHDDEDLRILFNYIYDKFFLNYTLKQWGLNPDDIDDSVLSRVPIVLNKNNGYFDDIFQGVPSKGYSNLFKRMLDNSNIKVLLNTNFSDIFEIKDSGIFFKEEKFKGKLVYTGMIDELFNFKFGELPYRSLDLKFEKLNISKFQSVATVNYPNNFNFTRITEFKHIHPSTGTDKTIILKEFPIKHDKGKTIPFYPILTERSIELFNKYLEHSKMWDNLILLGRLAEFKYYDMDDIVERALIIFNGLRSKL